jgi:hypothetical protein
MDDLAQSYFSLGLLLENNKHYPEAEISLKQSLEIFSRLANKPVDPYYSKLFFIYYYLGNISLTNHDTATAVETFRKTLNYGINLEMLNNKTYYKLNNQLLSEMLDVLKAKKEYSTDLRNYSYVLLERIASRLGIDSSLDNYSAILKPVSNLIAFHLDKCNSDSIRKYSSLNIIYLNPVLKITDSVSRTDPKMARYVSFFLNQISKSYLYIENFKQAEWYARLGIEKNDTITPLGNRTLALALLLSGNYTESLELFKALKKSGNFSPVKTYSQLLLEDLQNLNCAGAVPVERGAAVEAIKKLLTEKE